MMPTEIEQKMFDELSVWMKTRELNTSPQSDLKTIIDESHTTIPVASEEVSGVLGSRSDDFIWVKTGQLIYEEELIELVGNIPISLSMTYISRSNHNGIFGKHWYFAYESRLVYGTLNEEYLYRLYLSDGRMFDFVYDEEKTDYIDRGNIGATLHQHEDEITEVRYYNGDRHFYQGGKLIREADQNNNYIDIYYDHKDRIEYIENNSQARIDFQYGSNHRVAQVTDQGGRIWTFEYNDMDMLSGITKPSNSKRHYLYNQFKESNSAKSSLLTVTRDSMGISLIEARYNNAGQATYVKENASNSKYEYQYNLESGIVIRTDKHAQAALYHYDKHGLINSILYPDETNTHYRWNSKKREAIIGTRSEASEIKVFDERNRLLEHTDARGFKTVYTYQGENPYPVKITGPKGIVKNKYDSRYNLIQNSDKKGAGDQHVYNDNGNIIKIIDPNEVSYKVKYNSYHQPAEVIDAKGNSTKFEYDNLGRQTSLTDAEGRVTRFTYNHNDDFTSTTDGNGRATTFRYDKESKLTELVDPMGNITHYGYDKYGRVTSEKRSGRKPKRYTYNDEGHLSVVQREDGVPINYSYDNEGRLIKEIVGDITTIYDYDEYDKLISAKTKNSSLLFSYTVDGEIESQQQDDFIVTRAYDNNELVNVSYLDQSINYERNSKGVIECINQNFRSNTKQFYDSNENLVKRVYPNDLDESIIYEDTGNISKIRTAGKEIKYHADKSGNIVYKDSQKYEYDNNAQLVRAGDLYFKYDAVGNVTHKHEKSANGESIEYRYQYNSTTSQLLDDDIFQYHYDDCGNLRKKTHKTTQRSVHYDYNAKNQLVRVHGEYFNDATGSTESRDLRYAYDAIGRRIEKRDGDNVYKYLYDKLNIVAILDEHNQTIATITHDEQRDNPLSITNENGTFYYHRDHQGSIIALSNEQGKIVESIEYDNHFGSIVSHDKKVETNNPYCYTCREFDAKDFYYFRHRYYDPQNQRFISEDPIGYLSGETNWYRYVENNPVNQIDPLGLTKKPCAALKKAAKRLNTLKKKIAKKLGKKVVQKLATMGASLVTGPGAILVTLYSIADSVWTLYTMADDLWEYFNTDIDGLTEACNRKKAKEGKKGETSKDKEKNKNCKKCSLAGTPVNPIYGSKILGFEQDLDFSINTPMPLVWQRHYDSSNSKKGVLGQGWRLLSDSHLTIYLDKIVFSEPNGRELKFDSLEIGEKSDWVVEQLTLSKPKDKEYHLDTGDGTKLIFKPSQIRNKYQLASVQDRNGNALRYFYNGYKKKGQEDRLTHIMTDDNRTFALRYLSINNELRLKGVEELIWNEEQDRGRDKPIVETMVRYHYSDKGDLIRVTNQAGRVTRTFEYNNHMMVAHKIPDGLESFYEYDSYTPHGKVTRNWTNTNKSWEFDYQYRKTIATDCEARKTTYLYDEDQYLIGTIDTLGQSTTIDLDNKGLPTKITNEAGQEQIFYFDSRGNPIVITDFDEASTQISYHDEFDLPIQISDDLGNTTSMEYDDKGNMLVEIQPDGARFEYEYDSRGLPVTITGPSGGPVNLSYDTAGNLVEQSDCSNKITKYHYDRNGNLSKMEDAVGQITHYQYDKEHRLIRIRYPDNSEERFDYNARGDLVKYTDGKGNSTHYELDLEGRPTKRTNGLGGELGYEYDRHGRLITLTNENKARYHFEYDPLDRMIREQGLDGLITSYRYDPIGNVVEKVEDKDGAEERHTKFQRDKGGRLIEKYIGKGPRKNSIAHSRTRYQYDPIGQLIQARNTHSRVDLSYDPTGRIKTETTTTEHGAHRIEHKYDGYGNRLTTKLPNGQTLNWLYYGTGHLHQINVDGKVISDYERDDLHREVMRTQGSLQSQVKYDPLGRITAQATKYIQDRDAKPHPLNNQGTSPVRIDRKYSYDKSGELVETYDLRHGDTRYKYDAIGRITHTKSQYTDERFAFDPAHNIILIDEQGNTQENGAAGYIEDNRLRVFEDKRYEYDAFGNMISKRIGKHTEMAFSYDAEHQMDEAIVYKNGVQQAYRYEYDPFGRRIAKSDAFGTTYFIWDGNRLLSEYRGEKSKTFIYEQQGFEPVAQIEDKTIRYYHNDQIGTPRELTNQNGEIVWEAVYTTWGNTVKKGYQATQVESLNELALQPLRFQGQYFDVETGLHYNRFRYYDPDVGRFISQDPIGLLGGENLFQYASNPIGWVDPLGLACYTQKSRDHVYSHGHAANSPQQAGKSRFRPTEGGQKFTDEVINHPNVTVTNQGNGRILYEVDDLGRTTGRGRDCTSLVKGGAVVVEGASPAPWSNYVPDEVVTQFPK